MAVGFLIGNLIIFTFVNIMKPTLYFLYIFSFIFFIQNFCHAQGTLDETFGDGGKIITKDLGGYEGCGINSALMQPDGKIIVAGTMINTYIYPAFGLIRYTSSGQADVSFGNNGLIIDTFNISYLNNSNISVALQSDKKIIVCGLIQSMTNLDSSYIGIARYLQDGSLDSSFGNGGNTLIPGDHLVSITKAVILNDDKIIIVGQQSFPSTNTNFVMLRLYKNGIIDSSFGINGYTTTFIASYNYYVHLNTITTDSSGNFLLGGSLLNDPFGNTYDYLLMRYKPSGKIDSSFGDAGRVTLHSSNNYSINIKAIAVQSDKKIIVTGENRFDNSPYYTSDFLLTRFTSSGTPDSTFGTDGNVITRFPGTNSTSSAITIDTSNKFIVSGTVLDQAYYYVSFALAKYNSNGTLDSTFGDAGLVITQFDQPSISTKVLLQPDNKIIQIGGVGMGHGIVPALARFNNSGNSDTLIDDIISFEAIEKPYSVVINWQTVSEEDIDYFIVERSDNIDNNYKEIGKVLSKGNSNQRQQYSFEDLAPVMGLNYYRLKQVSKDGQISYEESVVANFNGGSPVIIYPNPVTNKFTIKGLSVNITTNMVIIDIRGSIVAKASTKNSSYTWNVEQLTSGTYFLRIDQNNKTQTLRFVKQ